MVQRIATPGGEIEVARLPSTPDGTAPSCLACAHFPVCAVQRAVRPLLASWDQEASIGGAPSPIDPDDFAWICGVYAPIHVTSDQTAVDLLQERARKAEVVGDGGGPVE